jgi:hypothetical protein
MIEEQQLQALLRLKRYEQPPAGYYEKLLQDIHRRQRSELLRRPLWAIALERVQIFFSEHSMGGLSYAGALAAVALAGLVTINIASRPEPAPLAVAESTAEVTARVHPVDLREEMGSPAKMLSLQNTPVVMAELANDDLVGDARLIPAKASRDVGMVVRQPRYVIDSRPVSYDAAKVSFSF